MASLEHLVALLGEGTHDVNGRRFKCGCRINFGSTGLVPCSEHQHLWGPVQGDVSAAKKVQFMATCANAIPPKQVETFVSCSPYRPSTLGWRPTHPREIVLVDLKGFRRVERLDYEVRSPVYSIAMPVHFEVRYDAPAIEDRAYYKIDFEWRGEIDDEGRRIFYERPGDPPPVRRRAPEATTVDKVMDAGDRVIALDDVDKQGQRS